MRERIESEIAQHWSPGYLVGIEGLVLAGISVYYTRADYNRQETQGTQENRETPEEKPDGPADGVEITKDRVRWNLDTLG